MMRYTEILHEWRQTRDAFYTAAKPMKAWAEDTVSNTYTPVNIEVGQELHWIDDFRDSHWALVDSAKVPKMKKVVFYNPNDPDSNGLSQRQIMANLKPLAAPQRSSRV